LSWKTEYIPTDVETFRKKIEAECSYRMKDETMDKFLGLMTEMKLKRNQSLISYGEIDTNVYVLREGILKNTYFDGFREMTLSFSVPAGLLFSFYPFCKDYPSFTKYQACCDSVVMKIPRIKFFDLIDRSHDFAKWVIFIYLQQLFLYEKKRQIISGDAKERFEALINNRPEIVENVSSRSIASYIGVTPEYLSVMKRQFSDKLKK
jgi:CRP-like cAMP-binding protein